jgi:hypothetical protein
MDANEWLAIEKQPGGGRGEIDRLRIELDAARARVAALETVAEAARAALDADPTSRAGAEVHLRLEAALDAAPATALSGSRNRRGTRGWPAAPVAPKCCRCTQARPTHGSRATSGHGQC